MDKARKPFWLSWYALQGNAFTYHGPWWYTGQRLSDGAATVVAAVMAVDEEDAKRIIQKVHDNPKIKLEWRFVSERSADWSPYGDRFVQADWMQWPYPVQRED